MFFEEEEVFIHFSVKREDWRGGKEREPEDVPSFDSLQINSENSPSCESYKD